MADDTASRRELLQAYMAMNNGQLPPDVAPEDAMNLLRPTEPQSPKALLDAYRAMNGGALPPGMTPEQAALIDMGLSTEAVTQNPALAGILQQLAQQRTETAANYAAAREQVGQNYQNLTQDVSQQGTTWMNNLLTSMGIDPTQAAVDPNIGTYGTTIDNMVQTAAQNQATDQAWFDKMAQTQDSFLANQMIAAQMPQEPDTSGGGGGGGGRGGRGRRGYGGRGGGSGGDWRDPKTTETATEAAGSDFVYNNPDFAETVLSQFTDPAQVEYAQRILDTYKGIPGNVAAGIADVKLPAIEALQEASRYRIGQRQAYFDQLPAQTAGASVRATSLQDEALGRAPGGQTPSRQIVGQTYNYTDKNSPRALMDETQRADYNTEVGTMLLEGLARLAPSGKAAGGPNQPTGGFFSQIESRAGMPWAEITNRNAQYIQQERDKERLAEAQRAATTQNPFTFEGWQGYVPQESIQDTKQRIWDRNVLENVLAVARAFHPNYGMQEIKRHMDDDSKYTTSQTSYESPPVALFDNNLEPESAPVSATGPGALPSQAAVESNNMSGAAGFGQARGMGALNAASKRILENRLNRLQAAAEAPAQAQSAWDAFDSPFRRPTVGRTGADPVKPNKTVSAQQKTPKVTPRAAQQTLQQRIAAQKAAIERARTKNSSNKKNPKPIKVIK